MKRTILIIALTLLAVITYAQTFNKIVPQFKFTQIDSLIKVEIKKHSNNNELVLGSVAWGIGSYFNSKDRNYVMCNNYFHIYILFSENHKYFIQQLDNFGYFKVKKVKAKKIRTFLDLHLNQMKSEQLNPKIDTITEVIDSLAKKITKTKIIQSYVSHQLWEQIKISYADDSLTYEYPAGYSNNKYNLLTYKYNFLQLIKDQQKQLRRKKPQRVFVINKAITLAEYDDY